MSGPGDFGDIEGLRYEDVAMHEYLRERYGLAKLTPSYNEAARTELLRILRKRPLLPAEVPAKRAAHILVGYRPDKNTPLLIVGFGIFKVAFVIGSVLAVVDHGDRAPMPPLRLGRGPGDLVVWGEYASALPPKPMRIFVSRDGSRNFQPSMTLERGTIGHVHNVFWDPAAGHYWLLAGDHGPHPGIARISADFTRLERLGKGDQRYRAVHVFDLGDRLLYATDSEVETNRLVSLDKTTGRTETLRTFEGSCIYACRFGSLYAQTTTVEPSRVNRSRDATLWLSRDGEEWRCAWRARKDRWHADYFQFGSIALPAGASPREVLVFSGQAVRGLDGKTVVARLGDTR